MSITQEVLKEVLSYDPLSGVFIWVSPPKYHPRLKGEIAGSKIKDSNSDSFYWRIKIDRFPYRRSSLALLYMEGQMPELVDHRDGNTLNDRYENLRAATVTQNNWNHKPHKKDSLLPAGVRKINSGNYQARIQHQGKLLSLGTFDNPSEASEVYEAFRKNNYGEFYAPLYRG